MPERTELHYRPDNESEGGEGILQGVELPDQFRVHAFPILVFRPELVSERFDYMVGGHPEMNHAP